MKGKAKKESARLITRLLIYTKVSDLSIENSIIDLHPMGLEIPASLRPLFPVSIK
jgi:hypothetical protein